MSHFLRHWPLLSTTLWRPLWHSEMTFWGTIHPTCLLFWVVEGMIQVWVCTGKQDLFFSVVSILYFSFMKTSSLKSFENFASKFGCFPTVNSRSWGEYPKCLCRQLFSWLPMTNVSSLKPIKESEIRTCKKSKK